MLGSQFMAIFATYKQKIGVFLEKPTLWSMFNINRLAPRVDAMVAMFCDIRQFSAKKFAFFSKTNVMIKFVHNLALFWVKRPFVRRFFVYIQYFKNHYIGP
jgi:hypothetical protein